MELCACNYNQEVIKDKQEMLIANNVMILMMTTHEEVEAVENNS